ncbi:uncharacterized protein OCT59_022227 [Rhizophagus irregularis]|uniref:RGS domain-containing protein n=5 Tax=Rhizophagus irregularis TaxID=588596 RepID=A0A915ZG95_9GLOM|nr:regulator of G Protein signaling domain protein [Rhizophagus irregularis DAOM 181602=DAOM 197198]EXX57786.1 hypothetical protein RirG_203810 [Rhizophagus irregularis DAOM 197198w]UZO28713.1 hypothetical protein OCT59_022227 [Rhizophagus irregularis]POG78814.1 regulator of G Protein signaling domain protein [Rhizophagus irregularis DAOM 181602=DAOM 197198]CAB4496169.1 unnamed protein product [Rhizophagus irregularis]CAB5194295.1 unnamed protein product [Rhizophagus irregularis]|eukprot:XP_025185680.1 regulator of G Protein signaling domain protein [Rhizophagus irregularis DAOM 181602=DAOM 197198]
MRSLAKTKPTLSDVLNNETSYPYSLDDFATFLDQTFCLENLEFYLAVKRYRYYASNYFNSNNSATSLLMSDITDIPEVPEDYYFDDASLRGDTPAHMEFLKQKLVDIITTFILPNSPKEINILSVTRDDLLTNVFQYNNYHPSILDPVRNQVYELMQASSFNQFLLEAGNTELRMSSEESEGVDSDYSSSSSSGVNFRGITRSTNKNNRTKQTFGAGLKQKYRKLIKTTSSKINGNN